jgi:hypothetical protein
MTVAAKRRVLVVYKRSNLDILRLTAEDREAAERVFRRGRTNAASPPCGTR